MKKILLLATMLLILLPVMTFAATKTATLNVNATVLEGGECVINGVGALSFSSITPPISSPIDHSDGILVTCPSGTPYAISLSTGGSGSYAQREMDDGSANKLQYNIYTDSAHTTVWGDGTGSTSVVNESGNASMQEFPFYGRIPTQITPVAGSYADTVTVTVIF